MAEEFIAKGASGNVIVTPTSVTLAHKGMLSGGRREVIPIGQVTAVDITGAGIRKIFKVSFPGGSSNGLVNAIVFDRHRSKDFERARDLIFQYQATMRSPGISISVADELEKLATLRDKKVISDAEFEAKKKQLLDM